MTTKIYMSDVDAVVDPGDAKVSVFDRGFLYGDSVYETMRTVAGKPVELRRHLARLQRSAGGIGLEVPFTVDAIRVAIARAHHDSDNDESYVRVVLTRGTGPLMLDPRRSQKPLLVVMVTPLKLPDPSAYETGVRAAIVDLQKNAGTLVHPSIKSGNYLSNIMALRQAIAVGADDAIMSNPDGTISEGATSNVFVVLGGVVHTPDLESGVLPGITREVVCELVTACGLQLIKGRIARASLATASELFLTSSVRGIMPVTRVDDEPVGDGRPGPVTRRLRAAYDAYLVAGPD